MNSQESLKILLISPVPSHPQNAGNQTRVYTLLKTLGNLGHTVYFVHIQQTKGDTKAMKEAWGDQFFSIKYKAPLTRKQGFSRRLDQRIARKVTALAGKEPLFNYAIDDWYDEGATKALRCLSNEIKPDIVIVEYVFFSKALEVFDRSVLKVIDTHDILADRYKIYQQEKICPRWFSTSKEQENKGLSRADIVISIQNSESRILAKRMPSKKIVSVGHLVTLKKLRCPLNARNLLFVGSSNEINVVSLQSFLNDSFPLIQAQFNHVKLLIAGDVCEKVDDRDACIKFGRLDNLENAYSQADIVISPIKLGTGLKIKNVEALGYGKPLITTSVGAAGIESGKDKAFLVSDTPSEFVAAVGKLFEDSSLLKQLSDCAFNFAKEWNFSCVEGLEEVLTSHVNQVSEPFSSVIKGN